MKHQNNTNDITTKYEQLRSHSKQRLIGSIIILLFALLILLYVVAKIKPLNNDKIIIVKNSEPQVVNQESTVVNQESNTIVTEYKQVANTDKKKTPINQKQNLNQSKQKNLDHKTSSNQLKLLDPEAILNGLDD